MKMNRLLLLFMLAFPVVGWCETKTDSSKTTAVALSNAAYPDPAPYGKPFAGVPNTKDIVMYEVNLRSFSNTFNFKGVINRLDSIKALGTNVIWLMPIYPVGQLKSAGGLGSPYSIKDYQAVNSEFGTIEDLRALVTQAHSRNMAVILDWVADHTSWDNSWINNKSWYRHDALGNIISPPGTGWNDVAALDYTSADMRNAMVHAMKYWILAADVDGYRCDAADFVPTDFWTQALDTLNKMSDRKLIFLAEGSKKTQFDIGFQMNYAFDFYNSLKSVFAGAQAPDYVFTTDTKENNMLAPGGFKLRYTTNHDVTSSDGSTVTIYHGKQGALAAFVLASYVNGVPLIYNGQEVGCPKPISIFDDDAIDWSVNADMTAEYKRIIAFRAAHEAVKCGQLTAYNDDNIIAFEKKAGNDNVLVLVNAKNSPVSYSVPTGLQNTAWTNGFTNSSVTLSNKINFEPYGYMILKRN